MSIDTKHPLYEEFEHFWESIGLLQRGGSRLIKHAQRFLTARPMEPLTTYNLRAERASYQNILAQALRWYIGKLFERDAALRSTTSAEPSKRITDFWAKASRRGGKSFVQLLREIAICALRDASVWVLYDLPVTDESPKSLADQKARGLLQPTLKIFEASLVTNWEEDDQGELLSVTTRTYRPARPEEKGDAVEQFYYFDRNKYVLYEREQKPGTSKREQGKLRKVDEGPHALSGSNRVPWQRISLPEDLWMVDQAYPLVLEHFNTSNALTWALMQSALAIPVVTGEFEGSPTLSETAYLQLTQGSTLTFAEPSGTSHGLLEKRVASLRDEIYRQFGLQAQARDSSSTAQAASGFSKELDMAPSADTLRALGKWLRDISKRMLDVAALVAGEKPDTVIVQGWEFEEDEALPEAETAAAVKSLDIHSDTFLRAMDKRMVRKYLGGSDPDLLKTIDKEIDDAPSQKERDAAMQQERMQRFGAALKADPKENTADDQNPV